MGAETTTAYGAASAATPGSSRKRKHPLAEEDDTSNAYNESQLSTPFKSKKPRTPKANVTPTEKRLRRFRPHPPQSFHEIHHRATTQRFYVLSRTRCGTASCPEEMVELTGSTGNIYTVTVAQRLTCDCPHALKGNQCKHVVYVLAKVLRARWELVYQLALVREELREIFERAPPPVGEETRTETEERDGGGRRKPVEGDCPICFCEMEAGGRGEEAAVWCRAACGQNIHKGCFETWAATKRRQCGGGGMGEVTCPYCRSVWEGDEEMVRKIEKRGDRNAEGYVNVASQLGISTQRDYSTYSRWWSGHPSSYRSGYY